MKPTQNLCTVCKHQEYCPFEDIGEMLWKGIGCSHFELREGITRVETNVYDQEELHTNCTVQILKNSITGETSIGWWENEEE